jgi:hypothetical protein
MGDPVTIDTEMKDATLLATALQAAGMTSKIGKTKAVLSDGEATASLDFKTGRLTYDPGSMAGKIGHLRQLYGEARYRAECERRGIHRRGPHRRQGREHHPHVEHEMTACLVRIKRV